MLKHSLMIYVNITFIVQPPANSSISIFRMSSIDFINEHQKDTVGEATQEFLRLLPDISYSTAERTVRFALREVIIERSGFNVSRE